MEDLSATEAARHFSELLDAIEHRGETFVISRRGRPVARIGPTAAAIGRTVKEILRTQPPDTSWAAELVDLRAQLAVEDRRWTG